MDKEGFIPVSLIASFKRVKELTNDIDLIYEVGYCFFFFQNEVTAVHINDESLQKALDI